MAMVHELRPRGQVAERALLATALNSALAVLLLKGWRVVAAVVALAEVIDVQVAVDVA